MPGVLPCRAHWTVRSGRNGTASGPAGGWQDPCARHRRWEQARDWGVLPVHPRRCRQIGSGCCPDPLARTTRPDRRCTVQRVWHYSRERKRSHPSAPAPSANSGSRPASSFARLSACEVLIRGQNPSSSIHRLENYGMMMAGTGCARNCELPETMGRWISFSLNVTVRPDCYPFQRHGSRSSTLVIL